MATGLRSVRVGLHLGMAGDVDAPLEVMQSLEQIAVSHSDQGRSNFQISFRAQRSGPAHHREFPVVSNPWLLPMMRVIITVDVAGQRRVLMDGIITNRELKSEGSGAALFTVTGEDVSLAMDRKAVQRSHPNQPESVIALMLIKDYYYFGLVPLVIPPLSVDVPVAAERIPAQAGTDYAYLGELAKRFDHVFYVIPGPKKGFNVAYWGPSIRTQGLAKPLTAGVGTHSNVQGLTIQHNAKGTSLVDGYVQDARSNFELPVKTVAVKRLPLAAVPDWAVQRLMGRSSLPDASWGVDLARAYTYAQAQTDRSADSVVVASGTLDTATYGDLLWPRTLVPLRGVGYTNDGLYYISSVSHTITRQSYTQAFQLQREGIGTTIPKVSL